MHFYEVVFYEMDKDGWTDLTIRAASLEEAIKIVERDYDVQCIIDAFLDEEAEAQHIAENFIDFLIDYGYRNREDKAEDFADMAEDLAAIYKVAPRLVNLLRDISDRPTQKDGRIVRVYPNPFKRSKTVERNNIIRKLFAVMRNDMGVMAEHGDSKKSLLRELCGADDDVLEAYCDTFLQ